MKQKLIDKILENNQSNEELFEILGLSLESVLEDAINAKLESMTEDELIEVI